MGVDIGYLLSVLIVKATLPLKWSDFGLRKPAVKIWVVIGFVLAGLVLPIITGYVWAYLSGLSYDIQIFVDAVKSLKLLWVILFMMVVVIISPIIEEIFFRGMIFSTLTEVSGIKIGLILQAILWAVIDSDISALPIRFVSGLVLAYVYYRSKSLLPSIVIHSLLNIVTFGATMMPSVG
ncbi:MAG: CPBP family intramembrane metalloprotease [Deltaproteobacteria bacterium]|nr:CPBP family intramembrane metalloprotease [Deltaproteobacteria bacterium]